tara:strand:- start:177 stop:1643 length:1467 start_codon:yes stop_codon:yes gene_type:complete
VGKLAGFLKHKRIDESLISVEKRKKNYKEFTIPLEKKTLRNQASRCMDCGIPFCQSGCPLGNLIPDFNDSVYNGNWEKAADILHSTNNFPEFTGRLCPAPCEQACVLGINEEPVSIENIEKNIVEIAFKRGWIKAYIPLKRTGKSIAIVGSGPSGLAAAQQLNRVGHKVTVYERESRLGGLLRYGIPDFKLEKTVIDRRIDVLLKEGIIFKTNTNVGIDISIDSLRSDFDAVLLCGGATAKRSLSVDGSNLDGVVQAMDFLKLNNDYVSGSKKFSEIISAKDKNVIVIGGGDTGSDCIGTSNRHGALSVTNFEILDKPIKGRPAHQPWPYWPMKLKTSSSHQEGVNRFWSISTKKFLADKNGKLNALVTCEVEWVHNENERPELREISGSEKTWPCNLVLLALGFTGPGSLIIDQLKLETDYRTNIKASTKDFKTNINGVFAAGDIRRGQSLIVWAISEGRQAAHHIDTFLMGSSDLPLKDDFDLPSA